MDAVDAVLADFTTPLPTLIAHASVPISFELRTKLIQLGTQDKSTLSLLAKLDVQLGHLFVEAVIALSKTSGVNMQIVQAIGSHGQTIFHQPGEISPTSIQIGDPNIIAERTGITTVADFRRRDIAAGGQGAPLVPAFHNQVFRTLDEERVVVNIGGIANITLLPANPVEIVRGFDTGPGNILMDAWTQRHLGTPQDTDGAWAGSGKVIEGLLQQLLEDHYFDRPPPKSTGREHFHLAWLEKYLARHKSVIRPEDVQASLCELSAVTIAHAIKQYAPNSTRVLVCGGGVHNRTLMQRLQHHLSSCSIESTMLHGIDPRWVEALAFAWLAKQTIEGRPGNLPAVTGAHGAVVLGGIYQGSAKIKK